MVAVLSSPVMTADEACRSVAICAADNGDAVRIARLLNISGLGLSDSFNSDAGKLSGITAYAAVICHRRHQSVNDTLLPDTANVARVIVLSDCSREDTAVHFLRKGARHFFDISEPDQLLEVRLEAALRQHRQVSSRSFSAGDIYFDVQKRRVLRAGRLIDLSPKEYEFARHLFSRMDKVVRNSELMTSVWSLPPHMDTRRIDTAACRVRKKLGLFRQHGWELKRIRCVGYRLVRAESALALNEC